MSSFITYSFSTTPEKQKAEAKSKRGEYRTHPRPKDLNKKNESIAAAIIQTSTR